MAFVSRIEVLTARLPFRLSFGHALAARRSSTNVYVKVTLDTGDEGFGEGVPREYVTGETEESAVAGLCDRLAPALLGREVRDPEDVPCLLTDAAREGALPEKAPGAAWCALELAMLDACGKAFDCSVQRWLGPVQAPVIYYDAVLPFVHTGALPILAVLIRLLHFRHVKVKVGSDLPRDLRALAVLRRILGREADIRVDANCAWTADNAAEAIARMRSFGISAVEQPVAADDLDGLRRLTAEAPEMIMVDESLRTVAEAETLAEQHACDVFNIRVSKCGGLLSSLRIAQVAARSGLTCVVGAQVGESGILSAAGRHLASVIAPKYVEGSAGRLLLKEDFTEENVLPGWGGRARPFPGPGLGVHVKEEVLRRHGQTHRMFEAARAKGMERIS
jgi:muconate cycloisomerase